MFCVLQCFGLLVNSRLVSPLDSDMLTAQYLFFLAPISLNPSPTHVDQFVRTVSSVLCLILALCLLSHLVLLSNQFSAPTDYQGPAGP